MISNNKLIMWYTFAYVMKRKNKYYQTLIDIFYLTFNKYNPNIYFSPNQLMILLCVNNIINITHIDNYIDYLLQYNVSYEILDNKISNIIYASIDYLNYLDIYDKIDESNNKFRKLVCNLSRALYEKSNLWKGVNLGGWFLLEPGPATPLFDINLELNDEYSFHQYLMKNNLTHILNNHRDKHYTEIDIIQIKEYGFNAVRIPFGHWIIYKPLNSDYYYNNLSIIQLENAVKLCEKHGLDVILDLHGCPGGENEKGPSGRFNNNWKPSDWNIEQTLEIIEKICLYFQKYNSIKGIQICNEPSEQIDKYYLIDYYDKACTLIRKYIPESKWAIILSIFPDLRQLDIVDIWIQKYLYLIHDNIVFDIHYYHTFFRMYDYYDQKLDNLLCEQHVYELHNNIPLSMVGEYSLARNQKYSITEMNDFFIKQIKTYNNTTHGYFFWNWNDYGLNEWNVKLAIQNKIIPHNFNLIQDKLDYNMDNEEDVYDELLIKIRKLVINNFDLFYIL